jgi:hypothetical protein
VIFEAALNLMQKTGADVFGPRPFQPYLKEYPGTLRDTAQSISVDRFERLSPKLREAGVMVFRLGQVEGQNYSKFALARHKNGWDDYFFFDDKLFSSIKPEMFIPTVPVSDLYVFQLLPTLTETSLVNLALVSGLLGTALQFDDPYRPIVPATGQSTFSFEVRPNSSIDATWGHDRGQVEIDALFTARRRGKDTLFLVEAKNSKGLGTLAKHKLVYPMLALRGHVPSFFELVPVYLRIIHDNNLLHFLVCECSFESVFLDKLVPASMPRRLVLQGFSL